MPFSTDVAKRAFERQGGRCARCGKKLVYENFERGDRGAWNAHHRKPERFGGNSFLGNCVVLCINPPNCHLNFGHMGEYRYAAVRVIQEGDLPYLYAGRK